jgi:hypothetical protein
MIKCHVCNYDNPLGRVHCIQCGTKIDLSKVVPPDRATGARGEVVIKGGARHRGKASIVRTIWKAVDLLILAALAVAILFMWQEPAIRDITIDAVQTTTAKAKFDTLTQAVQRNGPATVELSESEINAYINHPSSARRLEYTEDKPGATFLSRLTKYQIEIGSDQFAVIGVGEVRVSSFTKRVILRVDGHVVGAPGSRQIKLTQAFMGKLPLHALPAGQSLVDSFAEYFFRLQHFDAEWKFIKGARDLQLTPGRMVIGVGPAASAPAPAGS